MDEKRHIGSMNLSDRETSRQMLKRLLSIISEISSIVLWKSRPIKWAKGEFLIFRGIITQGSDDKHRSSTLGFKSQVQDRRVAKVAPDKYCRKTCKKIATILNAPAQAFALRNLIGSPCSTLRTF